VSQSDPGAAPAAEVLVRAELAVAREHLTAFRELAEQLAAAMREAPGTLDYRWFATGDPLRFVLLERYVDCRALFTHSPAAGDLLRRLAAVATVTHVQVHGELDARLGAWVASNPHAGAHPPLER